MQNLKDRVAWALSTIKSDSALNKGAHKDVELAESLGGIALNTFSAYKKGVGKGEIKSIVIEALVSVYNFSPTWLLVGYGEPFPGARSKYPDACGPDPPAGAPASSRVGSMREAAQHHGHDDPAALGQDLALAAKILSSGTHYATALHLNIRSFASGLDDLAKTEELADLKKRMFDLEQRLVEIQTENAILHSELTKLKKDLLPGRRHGWSHRYIKAGGVIYLLI